MSNLAREPLQLVEIDVDFCNLTFGTAPCTASASAGGECYNTYATCQDTANFDKGTLTLRFSKNQRTGIKGQIVFPALQSVSTNATEISLGSVDDRLGSLGKRARVKVALKDFAWSDQKVDPYVSTRTYDPMSRGTFFGKMRARGPYYYGRALRVKNGYVGDDIATMPTRNYIITEWQGPDAAGNVQITAQDPLKLADADLSQCPEPSNGKLETDIGTGLVSFDLLPASVGAEYDASGYATIGSEVVQFTRSGDTITLTERGVDGTEAATHSADDTFQQAYRVEDATIYDAARELLRDYAGVDTSFIPYSDWQDECDEWLASARLTRTVAKPTAVKTLLGQIADLGLIFWWDEIGQEVKLRANRPVGLNETVTSFSDSVTVIEGTLQSEDLHDQRISQCWFYHGTISATGGDEDPENYKRLYVAVDADAQGANEYDQSRIKQIYMPWLGPSGVTATAVAVTHRMVNRYRDTPQQVTFQADIKDRDTAEVAALIELTTRVLQDETGASNPTQMQVTKSHEVSPGHRIEITAQTYQFRGRYGFITENARGDYAASSASEQEQGTYIVDEGTLVFGDGSAPYVMF